MQDQTKGQNYPLNTTNGGKSASDGMHITMIEPVEPWDSFDNGLRIAAWFCAAIFCVAFWGAVIGFASVFFK